MSFADYTFLRDCQNILKDGYSDESLDVRPKWEDGTPAHTKKLFHVINRYDMVENGVPSIPVMTIRKTGFKNAIDEILWIYQKKSNVISELRSHIWDSWDIGDGTIGKAYGYQIGVASPHHKAKDNDDLDGYPSAKIVDGVVWLDQMDAVLYDLKNNCASRSIMTNTYNHNDLFYMGLRPCAYSMTYNVVIDTEGNKVLNGLLNQRSQDMLTANNWNVVQYSVLLHMIAQVCGMTPGVLTHMVADMHIYDRHMPIVQDLLDKNLAKVNQIIVDSVGTPQFPKMIPQDKQQAVVDDMNHKIMFETPHKNPTFWINPEVKNFYDFTLDDFKLTDYETDEFSYKIEVAI
jgi:thymidylate synthase